MPEPFLLEGIQLVRVHATKQRLSVALNSPRSVTRNFGLSKTAAEEAGFEIVGEDNEIFEAEIYLQRGDELGSIQIRKSLCPEATVVFINIVRT